jgi:hypothetical protein
VKSRPATPWREVLKRCQKRFKKEMVSGTALFSLPTPRLENSASGSMPGSIETVSEHLKKRLPIYFPFFIAHSLITNGTVTVLVSHH